MPAGAISTHTHSSAHSSGDLIGGNSSQHLGGEASPSRPISPRSLSATFLITEREWRLGILKALHDAGRDGAECHRFMPASVFTFIHSTTHSREG